jgi:predicted membrane-bound mannosyltransferase/DNA-binding beta-propeller fold protein YncE
MSSIVGGAGGVGGVGTGEPQLDEGLAWRRPWDALLARELHLSLEFWLYAGLIAVAFALRFADLGTRALHHDESLHATYSWYFSQGRGYQHDPLMHGPLLFHVTALVYLLFGATDATSRFAPALIGTALVFMPLLLRPWLGRIGAFAAAAFIAFSPSLLYYSRFIRHDPFVVFFTMTLIVSIMRYQLTRQFRWLAFAAAALSLSFASMEITFIVIAILLLYLDGSTAATLSRQIAAKRELDQGRRAAVFVALLPFAWLVVCVWPFIKKQRDDLGLDEMPPDGTMLLVLGLLAAPQFSAAVTRLLDFLHYNIQDPNGYTVFGYHLSRVEAVGGLTVSALLLVTFVVGLWWDQWRWLALLAIFYIPYFLLYTTFITNRAGWHSGIWGALSYWLDQQKVNRGTQPVYYYSMTVPTYEYLVLAVGMIGVVWHAVRRGLDGLILLCCAIACIILIPLVNTKFGNTPTVPFVVAAILLGTAAMQGDRLRQLLVFYFGALFFALSIAGEKMPWLTEHFALPLALLAALTVRDAFAPLLTLRGRPWLLAIVACLAAGAAGVLLALTLASVSLAASLQLFVTLLIVAALVIGGYALAGRLMEATDDRSPRGWPLRVAGMAGVAVLIGFLGVLTFRNDWRINFIHPDTPDEMLIYTQSSPDIPKVKKLIDEYARESGLGHNLAITVDSADAFTWPWAWYLRDYPNTGYPDLSIYASNPASAASSLRPGKIVIANAVNQNVMNAFSGQYAPPKRLHHRWWFPEDGYRTTTAANARSWIFDGKLFDRWWGYVTHRRGFAVPPSDISPEQGGPLNQVASVVEGTRAQNGDEYIGAIDSFVYFPLDWQPGHAISAQSAAGAGTAAVAPAGPQRAGDTLSFGSAGAGQGQFSRPAGAALDAAGNIYVADSLNNRIEKFDPNGKYLAAAGAPGTDVQFKEPWGVAVDGAGDVYVADTWNGRIVKLDPSLHFVKAWGTLTGPADESSPLDLYGPRAIAIDSAGNLWVTDTGHARLVKFDPDGKPLGVAGGRGSGDGQLDEPVGITASPDGMMYVADTWNNRIVWFDQEMKYRGSFGLGGAWVDARSGRGPENKPYMTALPDSTLLVTFPEGHTLVHYDGTGNVLFSGSQPAGLPAPLQDPLGVGAGADGRLVITDGVQNRVIRLPENALR